MTKKTYTDSEKRDAKKKQDQLLLELDYAFTRYQREYQRGGMPFNQYFNSIMLPDVRPAVRKENMKQTGLELRRAFQGMHKINRILGEDAQPLLKELCQKFKGTKREEYEAFKPVFKKILELEELDLDTYVERRMAEHTKARQKRIQERLASRPDRR